MLFLKFSTFIMNKAFITSFFLLLSFMILAQTPNNYYCNYSNNPIVIDGEQDDAWSAAVFSSSFVDISFPAKETPTYDTRFKMLWDENYLYMYAILEEPHINASLKYHDDIIYKDNDFEVFIDANGRGINYHEIEINSNATILDLFMNEPYREGGSANLLWNVDGIKKVVKNCGSINNPSDIDSCWSVEMAIPWKALNQQAPKEDDIWRMNFSRVEWDFEIQNGQYVKKQYRKGKKHPEHNWVWSPQGKINMHIPEQWGFVHFVKQQTPTFWVWMGAHKNQTEDKWDSTFLNLSGVGITGVLLSANADVLKKVIPIAKKHNVEIHAWFWTMNRGDAKAKWLSVNQNGASLANKKAYVNYYKFMCPALPEVKSYLNQKIDDLSEIPGLSGIHFDYIRYVDVILPVGLQPKYGLVQNDILPQFDYGYHPYMRRLYKKQYGIDPLRLNDPSRDSTWLWFRLHQLDVTVIDLKNRIKSRGLITSAAVFPTPDMSRRMVRQDWDSWKLDYYFPMVYHNFYNEDISWIEKVAKEDRQALGSTSRLFIGLYVPALKKEKDLTKAILAAFAGGADGVAFFNYGSLDSSAMKQIRSIAKQKGLLQN